MRSWQAGIGGAISPYEAIVLAFRTYRLSCRHGSGNVGICSYPNGLARLHRTRNGNDLPSWPRSTAGRRTMQNDNRMRHSLRRGRVGSQRATHRPAHTDGGTF